MRWSGVRMVVVTTVLLGMGCAHPPMPKEPIGTALYVNGEWIVDYKPESTLAVPETHIARSAYPAMDVHCHWSIDQDPQAMLAAMDERNVARAVNLSGGWGDELDAMLRKFAATDPDRLLVFCNIDWSWISDPAWEEKVRGYLRLAHVKGASGLKIFKNLGLTVRDASGELVAIDDPRLDVVWETCGELGMPILVHVADPPAFFDVCDCHNERAMQLLRHPDWSFHGEEFPGREELFEQFHNVLRAHRGTTFIGPHLASHAGDLARLGRVLDEHPNLVVDISGRVNELGRQPYSARRFMIDYQDRVLFGTDRYPGRTHQPRYRIYYRFLETDDQYFNYYDHPFPPAGDWKIYGVELPPDVLHKIYTLNFERVMSGAVE